MIKFTILLRRNPSMTRCHTMAASIPKFLDLHACEFVLSSESVFIG